MGLYTDERGDGKPTPIILSVVGFILSLLFVGMWGCPTYNVWQQGLSGQAALERAKQDRQIDIEEAKAKLESSHFLMKADSVRAEGTAEANRIIATSLTREYIQWLWVQGLHDGSSEVIYIATEANLPILEASRKK